jgi:hypothetical protein
MVFDLFHLLSQQTSPEPFDEYSSLALINNHYAVSIASNNRECFQDTLSRLTEWSAAGSGRGSVSPDTRLSNLTARIAIAESRLSAIEISLEEKRANREAEKRWVNECLLSVKF